MVWFGTKYFRTVFIVSLHCRPRRSCKCDSSLSVDTKKSHVSCLCSLWMRFVMNRRVVEPEYVVDPDECASTQARVHRVIDHCEIVNCCTRVHFFLWLLSKDKLLTRYLKRKVDDLSCLFYYETESVNHFLFDCTVPNQH